MIIVLLPHHVGIVICLLTYVKNELNLLHGKCCYDRGREHSLLAGLLINE